MLVALLLSALARYFSSTTVSESVAWLPAAAAAALFSASVASRPAKIEYGPEPWKASDTETSHTLPPARVRLGSVERGVKWGMDARAARCEVGRRAVAAVVPRQLDEVELRVELRGDAAHGQVARSPQRGLDTPAARPPHVGHGGVVQRQRAHHHRGAGAGAQGERPRHSPQRRHRGQDS